MHLVYEGVQVGEHTVSVPVLTNRVQLKPGVALQQYKKDRCQPSEDTCAKKRKVTTAK